MLKVVSWFLLGFITCGFVSITVTWSYEKLKQDKELTRIEQQTLNFVGDTSLKNDPPTINDLKIRILNGDEKINSTNKRFDDLYILGGIIITLLIVINIGVLITVDNKVDRYLKDNIDKHRDEAKNKVEEIKKYAQIAIREVDLIQNARRVIETP